MTDPTLRPSPIVARILAAIFDYSIIMVMVLALQTIWTTDSNGATVPTTASNWLSLLAVAAYLVVPHALWGHTVGKKVCRLVVVRADDSPVGWGGALVRFVVAYAAFGIGPLLAGRDEDALWWALSILQVAIPLAIYAPILRRADRRGLHDLVAGTAVRSTVPPLSAIVPPVS